jgi:hypothetical protein
METLLWRRLPTRRTQEERAAPPRLECYALWFPNSTLNSRPLSSLRLVHRSAPQEVIPGRWSFCQVAFRAPLHACR